MRKELIGFLVVKLIGSLESLLAQPIGSLENILAQPIG
jgi:hypothetical protein